MTRSVFRKVSFLDKRHVNVCFFLLQDTGEPGWWRGEIGGKEGVFPDNFVTVVTEGEKEVRLEKAWLTVSLVKLVPFSIWLKTVSGKTHCKVTLTFRVY